MAKKASAATRGFAAAPAPTAPTLEYFSFILPSRGVLYGDAIPGGEVQFRKLRSKEQVLITQTGARKVDAAINACLRLPNQFDPQDLLLTDRFGIMLALRTRTFGPDYHFKWTCDECGFTHPRWPVNITDDLNENPAKPGLKEPVEIELPDLEKTLAFRFLRGRDEKAATANARRHRMQTGDRDDPSHLFQLAAGLVSLDGEDFENAIARQEFMENSLTARDLIVIEEAIDEWEPGYDLRLYPACDNCGATNQKRMPFTGEFFRPSQRRATGGR